MPEAGHRVEATMRAAMLRERVNVAELARTSGIERGTIYALWNGRQPKPATMSALARRLGVSVGDLWAAWDGRQATETPDAAVTALRDLTPVLAALAAAVEKLAAQDARLDEMEATLRALVAPTIATGAAPRAPRRTRG